MAIHCNKGAYDMNISILKSTELIHHIILEKKKRMSAFNSHAQFGHYFQKLCTN